MSPVEFCIHVLELGIIVYSMLYAAANISLVLAGFRRVREQVRALGTNDLDLLDSDTTCPAITVIVPAYNEEVTIVESIKALVRLDYPSLEILVVNDGSNDRTLAVMREAFHMRRRDIPIRRELECARIRGLYECLESVAPNVQRLILVDKDNGGHADALNAGLNLAGCPYFIAIDADSLLDAQALKLVMRRLQEDPEILACGGQVGIANNCIVENGTVTHRALPTRYLPLCQSVEYLRSYTVSRTGFSRLDSLLILSGAFLVMQREAAIRIGGFLTGRIPSKLLDEYVGQDSDTVCEDMEVVVRLHRYERECGRRARVVHMPIPVCWTEVPSTLEMLSKQRRRWHKGLIEIMRYHRRMLFNPNYGRVGMFALPYFVLFELCGPYVEAAGYLFLPLLAALGMLSPLRVAAVMAIALGFGLLQSLVAVLCGTWLEPTSPRGGRGRSMLNTDSSGQRMRLIAACFLSELGFRQMSVWWRLRGTYDYMRGHKGWDKFARTGFQGAKAVLTAFALLSAATSPAEGTETKLPETELQTRHEFLLLGGVEHRASLDDGGWAEAGVWWRRSDGRSLWLGALRYDRPGGEDEGVILGYGNRVWGRAGYAVELRASPYATAIPHWLVATEAELAVGPRVGATWLSRFSRYERVTVLDASPGFIAYVRSSSWVAVRMHLITSWFEEGARDFLIGGMVHASAPAGEFGIRFLGGVGAESALLPGELFARGIRSRVVGGVLSWPRDSQASVEIGWARRQPERGGGDDHVHVGYRYSW